jgi:uncharacterized protein (TIGR03089 family)
VQSSDPRSHADIPIGHLGRLIAARAVTQGQRPFLTFTDGASGERTELGYGTFENWTAKAANLLVEELELTPGDVLVTDLGTHWTALVLQVAAWRAGVVVALPGAAGPGSPGTGGAGPGSPGTGAADARAYREGKEGPRDGSVPNLVVGTGMAGRMVGDPGEAIPFGEEVLAFPDDFADHAGDPDEPVLLAPGGALSSADLLGGAARLATSAGLEAGGRYLSTVPADTAAGVLAGPVLALATGGGVVLATATAPEGLGRLAESERATALLVPAGTHVPDPGVPVIEVGEVGEPGQ